MSTSYTIRNYQPADFDKYVRLNVEAEKSELTGCHASSQVGVENLGRPNYSPEQDLFIVEMGASIVGYMDITSNLKIGRAILDCFIHPGHRKQGLASRLLGLVMQRSKELGAKVAHINVPKDDVVANSVLPRLDFKFIRRFLELSLDVSGGRWQDIDKNGFPCRHLQRGEEDELAGIQNRSFADTWGYNPNTVEEIIYLTNLSDCSPEDIILVCDGDKTVGYCWTKLESRADDHLSEEQGRVYMLGVDPDYRGRGIGKRVLVAGLSYLISKGVRIVELTADSENRAACALYRSVGFKIRISSLWYEKVVD
jgi:mycothiol synthase